MMNGGDEWDWKKKIIKYQGKSYPTSKAQGENQQLWCVRIVPSRIKVTYQSINWGLGDNTI